MIVVVGDTSYNNDNVFVYDDDGNEQWTASHGGYVYCAAIDTDGNVYTGGASISSVTTRKYDSGGNLIWSKNHGATVYGIAVDGDGNVYTGGASISSVTTRCYNSSGDEQWTANAGSGGVRAIAVSGDVVVTGGGSSSSSLRTYALDGTAGWTARAYSPVYGVAIDDDGNVYGVGDGNYGDYSVGFKYNSSGTLLSSYLSEMIGYGASVDSDGNFYFTTELANYYSIYKYNSSATLVWRKTGNINTAINSYGIFWKNVVEPIQSQIPALIISVLLAAPSGGIPPPTYQIPQLPVAISIALPSATTPPLPPEMAGLPVAKIYRAWVSALGGSTLLELPLASFQCVRRANESTWLTVTLSTYTPALAAQLAARIGGDLVIDAGHRLAGGNEVLGRFLRATVTAVEHERERGQASIRVTARVINPAYVTTTRALYGIQNQNSDNGRITVICETDPLLRPGDTALAARGVSFVVGTIRYAVSPHGSIMELTEAL